MLKNILYKSLDFVLKVLKDVLKLLKIMYAKF
jgi:hypothetical protein